MIRLQFVTERRTGLVGPAPVAVRGTRAALATAASARPGLEQIARAGQVGSILLAA